MTINYNARYAEKITEKNEITNFDVILKSKKDVSAVSWERTGYSRREFGAVLLKDMFDYINGYGSSMHIMLQLVPEQPNTAVVKHKRTWGLIESKGTAFERIFQKESFMDVCPNGLIMTGTGLIASEDIEETQALINRQEKLFFSNLRPDKNCEGFQSDGRLNDWVDNIIERNGFVLFILGRFDEQDVEVVALGKKELIYNIFQ